MSGISSTGSRRTDTFWIVDEIDESRERGWPFRGKKVQPSDLKDIGSGIVLRVCNFDIPYIVVYKVRDGRLVKIGEYLYRCLALVREKVSELLREGGRD